MKAHLLGAFVVVAIIALVVVEACATTPTHLPTCPDNAADCRKSCETAGMDVGSFSCPGNWTSYSCECHAPFRDEPSHQWRQQHCEDAGAGLIWCDAVYRMNP